MTTLESSRRVFGGVDTHGDVHVAAALDEAGGVLGTATFSTRAPGYRELHAWLCGFGQLARVGVDIRTPCATASIADAFRHLDRGCRKRSAARRRSWSRQPRANLLAATTNLRPALQRGLGHPRPLWSLPPGH